MVSWKSSNFDWTNTYFGCLNFEKDPFECNFLAGLVGMHCRIPFQCKKIFVLHSLQLLFASYLESLIND